MTDQTFDLRRECIRLFRDADGMGEEKDRFEGRLKVLALMEKIGLFTDPVQPDSPKRAGIARGVLDSLNGRPKS